MPLAYKGKVDEEISRILRYGVIERCNSPYVNPLVTVIKKDGRVRLCLDARKVNSVTIPDYEGVSPINDILARCSEMKYLSTVDLLSLIHIFFVTLNNVIQQLFFIVTPLLLECLIFRNTDT